MNEEANTPSFVQAFHELVQAAEALLAECRKRSESSHPMRYTCPWGLLVDLQDAIEAAKQPSVY